LEIFENVRYDERCAEIGEVGLLGDGLCVVFGLRGYKGCVKDIGEPAGDPRDSAFGDGSLLWERLYSRSGRCLKTPGLPHTLKIATDGEEAASASCDSWSPSGVLYCSLESGVDAESSGETKTGDSLEVLRVLLFLEEP
jgi:hypothetical protein